MGVKRFNAIKSSGLGNYFVCKRFAVQILMWSLEFVIQINLEHDTSQFKPSLGESFPKLFLILPLVIP